MNPDGGAPRPPNKAISNAAKYILLTNNKHGGHDGKARCTSNAGQNTHDSSTTFAHSACSKQDGAYPADPMHTMYSTQHVAIDRLCQEYFDQLKRPLNDLAPKRAIPRVPERILDAPGIVDDFYMNCLDWSVKGTLAIALDKTVYLWSQEDEQAVELTATEDQVSSLSWIHDGTMLAIGLGSRQVQIWDVQRQERMRTMLMAGDARHRVSCLSWNKHLISAGSRSGDISTHDVRVGPRHLQAAVHGHHGEVCGLKWSWDGRHLASGGNDSRVNIYDSQLRPVHSFSDHLAAVKAVAWCPWQAGLLATGGGSADRHVRFYSALTGSLMSSHNLGSQVSAILWSRVEKEWLSVHGSPDNQLQLWRHSPQPARLASASMAHDARILHAAMSPCGELVCTAGADESLKFWRIWESRHHGEDGDGGKKVLVPKLLPTFAKNKRQQHHSSRKHFYSFKNKK